MPQIPVNWSPQTSSHKCCVW